MTYVDMKTALGLEQYMAIGPAASAEVKQKAKELLFLNEIAELELRPSVNDVLERIIASLPE